MIKQVPEKGAFFCFYLVLFPIHVIPKAVQSIQYQFAGVFTFKAETKFMCCAVPF
jgi:hypothetical protein